MNRNAGEASKRHLRGWESRKESGRMDPGFRKESQGEIS